MRRAGAVVLSLALIDACSDEHPTSPLERDIVVGKRRVERSTCGDPRSPKHTLQSVPPTGWADLNFSQIVEHAAQRYIAETYFDATDNQIREHGALPGGVIYDSRSPHYRDLLDTCPSSPGFRRVPRTRPNDVT
ncbi:MAG TPA: hypothetical protein VGM90_12030 [Kofleriaceae bacterium]|jgi:hypothetical protein